MDMDSETPINDTLAKQNATRDCTHWTIGLLAEWQEGQMEKEQQHYKERALFSQKVFGSIGKHREGVDLNSDYSCT